MAWSSGDYASGLDFETGAVEARGSGGSYGSGMGGSGEDNAGSGSGEVFGAETDSNADLWLAVTSSVLLAAAAVCSWLWRARQLQHGARAMVKVLEAASIQSKHDALVMARFGAWGDGDPAAELHDDSFCGDRKRSESCDDASRRSPAVDGSVRSASSMAPSPCSSRGPFREYVWNRDGFAMTTPDRRQRQLAPSDPPDQGLYNLFQRPLHQPLSEPPMPQPSAAMYTESAAPIQPRYIGVYPSPYVGGTYSCRAVHPEAPVTTTQVLRSADGRRNTAFHVVTTRKPRIGNGKG